MNSYSLMAQDKLLHPHTVFCYELTASDEQHGVGCVECQRSSNAGRSASYRKGEAVLVGMLDSPYGDGQAHYFCNHHLETMFPGLTIDRFDPDKPSR
jgi:hypothetical protein